MPCAPNLDPISFRVDGRRRRTRRVVVARSLVCAIACVFTFGAVPAAAQRAVPDGLTMHRKDAGKPDKSGWVVDAASTGGAFRVALPCRFNDFTFEDTSEGSRTRRTDTVGCATANGRRFSASRIAYRGGAKEAEAFFNRGKSEPPWRGATQRVGTHGELPMVESTFEDGRRCGHMRLIHAAPENVLLVVEAPKVACAGLASASRRFFESVAVDPR
jgi:hypothetical protein